MPSYRGHLAGGVVTYLALIHIMKYTQMSIPVILQGLVFCLLGSLFPDIDVKSKGQKIFYIILLVLLLYCLYIKKWYLFITASLLGIVPMLVRHRGLFHQIWFLFAISFCGVLCVKSFYRQYETMLTMNLLFFFAGSLSHVILDRSLSNLKKYF